MLLVMEAAQFALRRKKKMPCESRKDKRTRMWKHSAQFPASWTNTSQLAISLDTEECDVGFCGFRPH